ncbi:hypothetical protein V6Z11_D12G240600 [Gossypium hirsutum]
MLRLDFGLPSFGPRANFGLYSHFTTWSCSQKVSNQAVMRKSTKH